MSNDNHLFEAWCSLHQSHPTECFYIHHPEAKVSGRSITAKKLRKKIARTHLALQKANKNGTKPHS